METVMPRGLFENTQEIYAEIASYPVVPPEKIKQYWNAYTTTFRRLFDPSAFRLENFWWHVWGSDRLRYLSGPTLAKLFEEFSNGPTFVPLPSPADHFTRSKTSRSEKPRVRDQEPSNPRSLHDGSGLEPGSSGGKKEPTPSSARPPPPHPILKKSRGPSSSGPRPTARFASPPASSDEVINEGEVSRAGISAAAPEMPPLPLPPSVKQIQGCSPATALPVLGAPSPPATAPTPPNPTPAVSEADVQPPAIPPPRLARPSTVTGRKIVANTAASRRRPTAIRRKSSHSSTGSESGPRVAGFVTASQRSGSKRSTPTASQLLGPSPLSSQTSDFLLSEKAAGKRPAKTATSKQPPAQNLPTQANGLEDEPAAAQQMHFIGPQRRSTWDVRDSGRSRQAAGGSPDYLQLPRGFPSQAGPPPVAGFVDDGRSRQRAAPTVRSRSTHPEGPRRIRELGVALLPSRATSSVAAVTTTARGQFDSETLTLAPVVPGAKDVPDGVLLGSQQSSSVLSQKFKPTAPNPAPPIPFGRSRSELTLLLKRGKPVNGEDMWLNNKKTGI